MKNHLKDQTSPYLLQHADNPVHWYPWCKEAFAKAKEEDKPIFLSIGYSTCHWCHVMAHESFEDEEVAQKLNQYFVSIKVDREERPDIDSVYMEACLLFQGSGGWPASIFLTHDQKPFFAGTYFPKTGGYGRIGFLELLEVIHEKWQKERDHLLKSAKEAARMLQEEAKKSVRQEDADGLTDRAFEHFSASYDMQNGGFGSAPKFPMPHNLMFLLEYWRDRREPGALAMAEKTLIQMYRGGLFDHIGYGFSRYSTDPYFLAPHFEKMLYDNALLLLAYTSAFSLTGKEIYQKIAEQTAEYIQREMTSLEGGFYSAQDADSQGVEGGYYVFAYDEVLQALGKEAGEVFQKCFDITRQGNFEGKNVPNRLKNLNGVISEESRKKMYNYRKERGELLLDDKILTAWNGLMIGAFANMYRVFRKEEYRKAAEQACSFFERQIENDRLFVSFRQGKAQGSGFLCDYAFYAFGMLELYRATLQEKYLNRAAVYCRKGLSLFEDKKYGGCYFYGEENETLIAKQKETYDGAIPSGNSVMTYNLLKLWQITGDEQWEPAVNRQMKFLSSQAVQNPAGHSFFLTALLIAQNPPEHIVCVLKQEEDLQRLAKKQEEGADILVLRRETPSYPLRNNKTTLYLCQGRRCLPPINLK